MGGKFVSTPGILENTWLKMRELSLAYTIPQKWLEKLKAFQNLTVSLQQEISFIFIQHYPTKLIRKELWDLETPKVSSGHLFPAQDHLFLD